MTEIERIQLLETKLKRQEVRFHSLARIVSTLIITHPDTDMLAKSLEHMGESIKARHLNDPLVTDDVWQESDSFLQEFIELARDKTIHPKKRAP